MVTRARKWWLAYRYELVAVVNGAIIMVLEIVGARIIAPQFGSSVYVWTAVIGVILGALSAGYWFGGRVADRRATDRGLAAILLLSAGVLLVSLMIRELSLSVAAAIPLDIRVQALVAAVMLFAAPNFLMGMVSPYLAKLKIASLDTAGASVGRLYAAGTLGSILGTFAAGYWLVAMMGSRALGLSLVLGLVTASLMADRRWLVWLRALVGMVAVVLLCLPAFELASLGSSLRLVYDGDSAYARWRVIDVAHKGQTTRLLTSDWMVPQSGIYLDKPLEPLFGYTRRFLEVARGMPAVKRVLLIGGGTYTFPEMIISKYPEVQVDVVEIDPKLDELAGHYFGYKPDPRVRIIHEDGRTFLNGNRDRYDLVVIDAFSSMVPPFQLTTTEAVDRVAQALNPGGVVAVNLISAREGAKAGFVRAEYATYREHFANVLAVPADGREPAASAQNMVLVASNGSLGRVKGALGLEGSGRVAAARALTDDFAPVEQMTAVR